MTEELRPEHGGRLELRRSPEHPRLGRWWVVEVTSNGAWPLAGPYMLRRDGAAALRRVTRKRAPEPAAAPDDSHQQYLHRRVMKSHPRA